MYCTYVELNVGILQLYILHNHGLHAVWGMQDAIVGCPQVFLYIHILYIYILVYITGIGAVDH